MIRSYFEQMNTRERYLVGMTGIFIILCLFYFAIYEPLANERAELERLQLDKARTLAWMKQVNQFAGKSSRKPIRSNSQLLTILAKQLSQPTLASFQYQLQQSSSGNVQLAYDEVPFNLFTKWLLDFQSTYSISIERLTATKGEKEGLVQLTVIFKLI